MVAKVITFCRVRLRVSLVVVIFSLCSGPLFASPWGVSGDELAKANGNLIFSQIIRLESGDYYVELRKTNPGTYDRLYFYQITNNKKILIGEDDYESIFLSAVIFQLRGNYIDLVGAGAHYYDVTVYRLERGKARWVTLISSHFYPNFMQLENGNQAVLLKKDETDNIKRNYLYDIYEFTDDKVILHENEEIGISKKFEN
jgi:hypothetical protein